MLVAIIAAVAAAPQKDVVSKAFSYNSAALPVANQAYYPGYYQGYQGYQGYNPGYRGYYPGQQSYYPGYQGYQGYQGFQGYQGYYPGYQSYQGYYPGLVQLKTDLLVFYVV